MLRNIGTGKPTIIFSAFAAQSALRRPTVASPRGGYGAPAFIVVNGCCVVEDLTKYGAGGI